METHDYYPDIHKQHLTIFSTGSSGLSFNTHDFFDQETGNFSDIPDEYKDTFLYYFALEVMLDQIMYTYFNERSATPGGQRLPKLSFCGHGPVTWLPWSVFRVASDFDKREFIQATERFLNYHKQQFKATDSLPEWSTIVAIIENDKDIHSVVRGVSEGVLH